jgi:hypothetical protein
VSHTLHQALYNKLRDVLTECKDGQLAEVCALAKAELETRVTRAEHGASRAERELDKTRAEQARLAKMVQEWKP